MPALQAEAFLAALLQDIGRLALLRAVPELYVPLSERAGRDHMALDVLERREFVGLALKHVPHSQLAAANAHHGRLAPRDDGNVDPGLAGLLNAEAVETWG